MTRQRKKKETARRAPHTKTDMIWAYLIHLGYNMWSDRDTPEWTQWSRLPYFAARPFLRCHTPLWRDLLKRMAGAGVNMVVIDLGEGVEYDSHPEIAVRRAWQPERLRRELARIRDLGLEPIPKFNFSTAHDQWLGPYARCVSTDAYYAVCRDLIAEAAQLFDHPRLFHLGMDEETAGHQRFYQYAVMRQHDLWWHDLYFLIEQVEKAGARPWIWSDYIWRHPDDFRRKMPRSVLQSNWYYGKSFSLKRRYVQAYLDLEKHRYDQVPAGSNYSVPVNLHRTAQFCRKRLAPRRLRGFLQTVWRPTLEPYRHYHESAIDLVADAKTRWDAYRTRPPASPSA